MKKIQVRVGKEQLPNHAQNPDPAALKPTPETAQNRHFTPNVDFKNRRI